MPVSMSFSAKRFNVNIVGRRPNIYPKWRNFLYAPNMHYRVFSLKLLYTLFYQFYAAVIYFFGKEMLGSGQASWCRTVTLVTEFSIRPSQPLKILIFSTALENLGCGEFSMALSINEQWHEKRFVLCIQWFLQTRVHHLGSDDHLFAWWFL